jgi:hypothetical protein
MEILPAGGPTILRVFLENMNAQRRTMLRAFLENVCTGTHHFLCAPKNFRAQVRTNFRANVELVRARGQFLRSSLKIVNAQGPRFSCVPGNSACTGTPFLRGSLKIVHVQERPFYVRPW